MTAKKSTDVATNQRNLGDITEIMLLKEAQDPERNYNGIDREISKEVIKAIEGGSATEAEQFREVPELSDITVDDLKVLISEVVAAELQKWSNQSTITVEPESKDSDNFASKKLYINADGMYILPKVTPEEQMQRNQELIALLDEWVEEGDAEEQRETYECLKQISRVSI